MFLTEKTRNTLPEGQLTFRFFAFSGQLKLQHLSLCNARLCGSMLANSSQNLNLTKECDCMKKQLQGIAIILVSILLMLGFGNAPVFDLSFRWSVIFTIFGIVGAVMTFLPDKK